MHREKKKPFEVDRNRGHRATILEGCADSEIPEIGEDKKGSGVSNERKNRGGQKISE